MAMGHDKVIDHYAEAYQKLYNRRPRDIQNLDNGWVIVNGARMKISEEVLDAGKIIVPKLTAILQGVIRSL